MAEYAVVEADELEAGEHLVVDVEGREIGVFNVDGTYHAYTNWCAHQGGPVCEGPTAGTARADFDRESLSTDVTWDRDGEFVACPWHGWEFDLVSGECLSKTGVRLIPHDVTVEDGMVVVST